MTTYATRTIPNLDADMRAKGATNEALAAESGVAATTISKARRGNPVLFYIADYISDALNQRDFKYTKRGPKGTNKER